MNPYQAYQASQSLYITAVSAIRFAIRENDPAIENKENMINITNVWQVN